MTAYRRKKGHDLEREIASDFREIGFTTAMTTREAKGGNWSETDGGTDLTNTGIYNIQCKNRKNYVSVNTIEEIPLFPTTRAILDFNFVVKEVIPQVPILITKANRKEPMAILPWKELRELLKISQHYKNNFDYEEEDFS